MSKLKLSNEMEVEAACLHQAVTIPGFGATGTTLSSAKMKGASFSLVPQGLLIEKDNAAWIIPHAAVGAYKMKITEEAKAKK